MKIEYCLRTLYEIYLDRYFQWNQSRHQSLCFWVVASVSNLFCPLHLKLTWRHQSFTPDAVLVAVKSGVCKLLRCQRVNVSMACCKMFDKEKLEGLSDTNIFILIYSWWRAELFFCLLLNQTNLSWNWILEKSKNINFLPLFNPINAHCSSIVLHFQLGLCACVMQALIFMYKLTTCFKT